MTDLIKPHKLNQGDTIGVFTPSTPAYVFNEELFKDQCSKFTKYQSLCFNLLLNFDIHTLKKILI